MFAVTSMRVIFASKVGFHGHQPPLIQGTQEDGKAYYNLRNETKRDENLNIFISSRNFYFANHKHISISQITDLNGNMLMICKVEICNLRNKIILGLRGRK